MKNRGYNVLEFFCKEFKIFIDTCSLLDDKACIFLKNIKPYLKTNNNQIIISSKVIEELEKHSKNSEPNKEELSKNAIKMLDEILPNLQDEGLIKIHGEKNDPFADAVFHYVFEKFRIQHKLLLITQDNKLAKEILSKNENESVKGYKIFVRRIEPKNGFLAKFNFEAQESKKIEPTTILKTDRTPPTISKSCRLKSALM